MMGVLSMVLVPLAGEDVELLAFKDIEFRCALLVLGTHGKPIDTMLQLYMCQHAYPTREHA